MSDRIFGVIIVVVALAYIASATQIQTTLLADPVGPKTFPYLVGAVIVIAGLFVIWRPDPDPTWPAMSRIGSMALAVVILAGYAYALKPMGFLIPTALASGLLSYQLRPKAIPAALTGIGLSIGLFVIFKYALGLGLLPLPKAWLG